jgi:hypothetical protein
MTKATLFALLSLVTISMTAQSGMQTSMSQHEYAVLTHERIAKALSVNGGKPEMALAEGSLMALGWYVIYGNGKASADLADQMAVVVTNVYNGTDKMDIIYMKHTSNGYGEMLNLNRFDNNSPRTPSAEYETLTYDRLRKAFGYGAGHEEFKLAEGSLCALGWMTLFGNDKASMDLADKMMNKAFELWRGANEVYMLNSSTAYAEMINLGRFKMDR